MVVTVFDSRSGEEISRVDLLMEESAKAFVEIARGQGYRVEVESYE